MILTFKGLRDEVQRLLDEAGTDAGATTIRLVKDFINQAHQQRCTEFPWAFMLWPHAETFTTVAEQHVYPLHQEFHMPLYFYNTKTGAYLREVPMRSLPPGGHRWTNSSTAPVDRGDALHFTWWRTSPVRYQPDPPSVLTIVSDVPTDVGPDYDVVIKGEDTNGVVRAEKLTPTGTAPVTGTIVFRTILGITKAGSWNGTLTLTDGDGTVLLTLLDCEMGRIYRNIFILERPDTSTLDQIEYRFYRQPMVLVNDYDIPEIPAPHAQILVWDALVMMSGYLIESNAQTLNIWRTQQMEAQMKLYRALGTDGMTLDAVPQFVRPYAWAEAL